MSCGHVAKARSSGAECAIRGKLNRSCPEKRTRVSGAVPVTLPSGDGPGARLNGQQATVADVVVGPPGCHVPSVALVYHMVGTREK